MHIIYYIKYTKFWASMRFCTSLILSVARRCIDRDDGMEWVMLQWYQIPDTYRHYPKTVHRQI
jgi:hypothetical protein